MSKGKEGKALGRAGMQGKKSGRGENDTVRTTRGRGIQPKSKGEHSNAIRKG